MTAPPTSNRPKLPLIVVEEHHEAFFAWHYAIARGWMPPTRCVLLHVDEHSDLRLPRLRASPLSVADPEAARAFTYRHLGIGNFILPAVLQGLFSEVVWLRSSHPPALNSRCGTVRTLDERGLTLALDWTRQPSADHPGPGDLTLTLAGPASALHLDRPVVLDLDLDYFGCPVHAGGPFEIEVTRETFDHFNTNPYHFLRLQSVPKVSAREQDGAWILEFDHFPETREEPPTLALVECRLDAFTRLLQASRLDLRFALLCRSVFSGYTDPAHAALLESRLIDALSAIYEVEVHRVDELG